MSERWCKRSPPLKPQERSLGRWNHSQPQKSLPPSRFRPCKLTSSPSCPSSTVLDGSSLDSRRTTSFIAHRNHSASPVSSGSRSSPLSSLSRNSPRSTPALSMDWCIRLRWLDSRTVLYSGSCLCSAWRHTASRRSLGTTGCCRSHRPSEVSLLAHRFLSVPADRAVLQVTLQTSPSAACTISTSLFPNSFPPQISPTRLGPFPATFSRVRQQLAIRRNFAYSDSRATFRCFI